MRYEMVHRALAARGAGSWRDWLEGAGSDDINKLAAAIEAGATHAAGGAVADHVARAMRLAEATGASDTVWGATVGTGADRLTECRQERSTLRRAARQGDDESAVRLRQVQQSIREGKKRAAMGRLQQAARDKRRLMHEGRPAEYYDLLRNLSDGLLRCRTRQEAVGIRDASGELVAGEAAADRLADVFEATTSGSASPPSEARRVAGTLWKDKWDSLKTAGITGTASEGTAATGTPAAREDREAREQATRLAADEFHAADPHSRAERLQHLLAQAAWLSSDITAAEVAAAVQQQQLRKSGGPDGMSTTALRAILTTRCPSDTEEAVREEIEVVTEELREILAVLYTAMIRCQHVAAAFRVERCFALWKQKGSAHDPDKYRGITVGNVFGKILQRVIHARISPLLTAGLPVEQSAYQSGRSVVEGPYVAMVAAQLAKEMGEPLYVIQLDTVKAYDRLHRDLMLSRLSELGVVGPLLGFMEAELEQTRRYVVYGGAESREWHDALGIKQGDVRSPLVYAAATGPFTKAMRAFAEAHGSDVGVKIAAELTEGGEIARLFLIVFADDVTILQIGGDNIQAILDCAFELSEREVFDFKASETVVTAFSPSADAPADLQAWTLGGEPVKTQRDVVVRLLGVFMGPHGPGVAGLGGESCVEAMVADHRTRLAARARQKLIQGQRVLASGGFNGTEHRRLFHVGPRSSLVWGRKLAWCVFWKAEWDMYGDWARRSLGIHPDDRVNMLGVFAEAGLLPPGVDHLRDAATFIDMIRSLPPDAPARVAFVADVKLCEARAGSGVQECGGRVPVARLLLCLKAASAVAAMQWGFEKLGLEEYFGGVSVDSTHCPWEHPPAPASPSDGDPKTSPGRGADLVTEAYHEQWPLLAAQSESLRATYLHVRPELGGDDWQLSIHPEHCQQAFHRLRLGAVRFHEWVRRHEDRDLGCPWCGEHVRFTSVHAMTECSMSRIPRKMLRGKLLKAIEVVIRSEVERLREVDGSGVGADPASDSSVIQIRRRVTEGLSAAGQFVVDSEADLRAWWVFLLGGDGGTCAPCPMATSGDMSRLGRAIRDKFRHIVPWYAHEILRVVEGGKRPRPVASLLDLVVPLASPAGRVVHGRELV